MDTDTDTVSSKEMSASAGERSTLETLALCPWEPTMETDLETDMDLDQERLTETDTVTRAASARSELRSAR